MSTLKGYKIVNGRPIFTRVYDRLRQLDRSANEQFRADTVKSLDTQEKIRIKEDELLAKLDRLDAKALNQPQQIRSMKKIAF